jgi:hypothetical protein
MRRSTTACSRQSFALWLRLSVGRFLVHFKEKEWVNKLMAAKVFI